MDFFAFPNYVIVNNPPSHCKHVYVKHVNTVWKGEARARLIAGRTTDQHGGGGQWTGVSGHSETTPLKAAQGTL